MSASRRKRKLKPRPSAGRDASPDLSHLLDIVSLFSRQTIAVVGDLVLDEFVTGEISRVSREAPVLILRHRRREVYPGGAANATNNLVDLGARVLPVGIVGDDEAGRALLDCFRRKRIPTSGVLRARHWVTATKTRFLAGWAHTREQQVLRVDREATAPISATLQAGVERKVFQAARRASAVLVSDYGLGVVSPALVKDLPNRLITLDSRYMLLDYRKTGVTAATPNEAELEAAYHSRIGTDTHRLEELGSRAVAELGVQALVVTRGKDGMAVFEPGEPVRYIPIYGTAEAVDVTGAGDTVIAVFTLALAAGASSLEAAHLANYAGGIVVMKARTATVTRAELEAAIRGEAISRH